MSDLRFLRQLPSSRRTRHRQSLAFEQLEPRLQLAGFPIISVSIDYQHTLVLNGLSSSYQGSREYTYELGYFQPKWMVYGKLYDGLFHEFPDTYQQAHIKSFIQEPNYLSPISAFGNLSFDITRPRFEVSNDVDRWSNQPIQTYASSTSIANLTVVAQPDATHEKGDPIEFYVGFDYASLDAKVGGCNLFHGMSDSRVWPESCTYVKTNSQLKVVAYATAGDKTTGATEPVSVNGVAMLRHFDTIPIKASYGTPVVVSFFNQVAGIMSDYELRGTSLQFNLWGYPAFGPDVVAVPNEAGGKPAEFFWHSLEDGGGFTFTYHVANPLPEMPDTKIDFYWARAISKLPAYTFYIDDEGVDDRGQPLKAEGEH